MQMFGGLLRWGEEEFLLVPFFLRHLRSSWQICSCCSPRADVLSLLAETLRLGCGAPAPPCAMPWAAAVLAAVVLLPALLLVGLLGSGVLPKTRAGGKIGKRVNKIGNRQKAQPGKCKRQNTETASTKYGFSEGCETLMSKNTVKDVL